VVSSDVIVVGAGPTGLMLAGDLAHAGVGVTVLDRLAEPSREPKANGVVGQAVRLLDHRGVLARLGHAGGPSPVAAFQFGGLPLDLNLAPRTALHAVGLSQQELESALAERLRERGVDVQRPRELVELHQDVGSVTVRVSDGSGLHELTAAYVVGCDGGSSRTRELAAIGFPGVTDSTVVSRSAEVSLPGSVVSLATAQIEVPGPGRLGLYRWNRTSRGAWAMLPRPSGTVLVSAMEWDRGNEAQLTTDEPPMSVPELASALERVLGTAVTMTEPRGGGLHQLRRWRGRNTRVADTYRRSRVLLAGDAAHVHNAVGAPGLNVGLQDAADLAWRLAGAVRGAPALLDGYELERRPAAQRVAMHSQVQTLMLAPGEDVTALRSLFAELAGEPAVTGRLAAMLEGSDVTYPVPSGAHPLAGRFLPDLDGLAPYLDDPGPVLLDFGAAPSDVPPHVTVADPHIDVPPAGALLVRPDGYVAWAADEGGHTAAAGLRHAVALLSGTEARRGPAVP
jgi:2-polyprenyl-6-methoxyphenol hydroxylase-like FAD-dependent oxidoreductase